MKEKYIKQFIFWCNLHIFILALKSFLKWSNSCKNEKFNKSFCISETPKEFFKRNIPLLEIIFTIKQPATLQFINKKDFKKLRMATSINSFWGGYIQETKLWNYKYSWEYCIKYYRQYTKGIYDLKKMKQIGIKNCEIISMCGKKCKYTKEKYKIDSAPIMPLDCIESPEFLCSGVHYAAVVEFDLT